MAQGDVSDFPCAWENLDGKAISFNEPFAFAPATPFGSLRELLSLEKISRRNQGYLKLVLIFRLQATSRLHYMFLVQSQCFLFFNNSIFTPTQRQVTAGISSLLMSHVTQYLECCEQLPHHLEETWTFNQILMDGIHQGEQNKWKKRGKKSYRIYLLRMLH